jgi:hypothetical protein
MPVHPPISDEKQARIVELARADVPRNKIARDVGVSVATVTKYAAAAGVSFDRAATREATAAAQADAALQHERLLARVRAGVAKTLTQLEKSQPKDLREIDQKARAYASLGSTLANVHKVTPVADPEKVFNAAAGEALVNMIGAAKWATDQEQRLKVYEARYGRLADEEVPEDTYGQTPAEAEPRDPERRRAST